jgi:hypothetical protein
MRNDVHCTPRDARTAIAVIAHLHICQIRICRITGFLDAWPKIEKWFNKFGILKKVDATLAEDVLYLEVEKILEDTLKKLQGVEEEESMPVEVTTETEVKEEQPVRY